VTWTAAACCRFREASLLAVEQLPMKQISKSFANAPAEDVFRPPRDFGGSRAASEKRQQAAAVHVVFA
jgi:hypothetical protein